MNTDLLKIGVYNNKGGSSKSSTLIGMFHMLKMENKYIKKVINAKAGEKRLIKLIIDADDETKTTYTFVKKLQDMDRNRIVRSDEKCKAIDSLDKLTIALGDAIDYYDYKLAFIDCPNRHEDRDRENMKRLLDIIIVPLFAEEFTSVNISHLLDSFSDVKERVFFIFTKYEKPTGSQIKKGVKEWIHILRDKISDAGFYVHSEAIPFVPRLGLRHQEGNSIATLSNIRKILVSFWNAIMKQVGKEEYEINVEKKEADAKKAAELKAKAKANKANEKHVDADVIRKEEMSKDSEEKDIPIFSYPTDDEDNSKDKDK